MPGGFQAIFRGLAFLEAEAGFPFLELERLFEVFAWIALRLIGCDSLMLALRCLTREADPDLLKDLSEALCSEGVRDLLLFLRFCLDLARAICRSNSICWASLCWRARSS